MSKLKEFFKDISETVTVTKLDGALVVAIAALAGVIVGMLISPRKNTKFGCGNGNTTVHNWNDDEEEWDDDAICEAWDEDETDEDCDCLSFN